MVSTLFSEFASHCVLLFQSNILALIGQPCIPSVIFTLALDTASTDEGFNPGAKKPSTFACGAG